MVKSSKIFVGYRALGFVCNHVPLSLRYINRRNENLVVTAIGQSFHTYGCSKLDLLSVRGQHPGDISYLTSDAYLAYTACENIIYAWRRGTELKHTYKGPDENVVLLLPFGPHLIAVYEDNTVIIWDIKAEEISIEILFCNFIITTILHPSTAVLAIAMDNFVINLVDIESRQIIREFGDNAGNITDMTFSADFKWLIAAVADSSIKTWDISSG
ncbi:WD repeat-containing protein 36, partial [Caerostris darwini]